MSDSNQQIIDFLNMCENYGSGKITDGLLSSRLLTSYSYFGQIRGGLSERWTGDRCYVRHGLVRMVKQANTHIRIIKRYLKDPTYEFRVGEVRYKELEKNKVLLPDGRQMTVDEFRQYHRPFATHYASTKEYQGYGYRRREILATYPTKNDLRCELARQKCRARIYNWALDLFDGRITPEDLMTRLIRVTRKRGWVNGATCWYNLLRHLLVTLIV